MGMYKDAGVNIQETRRLAGRLFELTTDNSLKDFTGAVEIEGKKIFNCCDGIGTKIIPLYERKMYKTIAADLVAANLNDMATKDVKTVGFCDYIAVNKLDSDAVLKIILELKQVLEIHGCKLTGGETAEMPDILKNGVIDISGFATGIGNEETEQGRSGDIIIGLKSSGIHSNGFSLIRKLYNEKKLSDKEFEECLTPSYIYYNVLRKLWDEKLIKSGANITGGGIIENLSRIVDIKKCELFWKNIPKMQIYQKLKRIAGDEIYDVFNCGIGFCIIADKKNREKIFELCKKFSPFEFGRVK